MSTGPVLPDPKNADQGIDPGPAVPQPPAPAAAPDPQPQPAAAPAPDPGGHVREKRDRALFSAGEHGPDFVSAARSAQRITIYDSVDPTQLPADTQWASYYANGRYANLGRLQARFPKLVPNRIIPVLVIRNQLPPLKEVVGFPRIKIDIEPTDWESEDAGPFCKTAIAAGAFPYLYMPLSSVPAAMESVKAAGIQRHQFKLDTAHWTGQPHICQGIQTALGVINADCTQWFDHVPGTNLNCDVSLAEPDFFVYQHPAPPPGHHHSYHGSGIAYFQIKDGEFNLDNGSWKGTVTGRAAP